MYTWDLDDDGSFDDGAGPVVNYVWATTGIYTVTVQVDDGDGGIATDETTVTVNTLVPLAWLGASYLLVRGRKAAPWKRKEAHICDSFDHRQWRIDHLS
jgi:PKD repeat protein